MNKIEKSKLISHLAWCALVALHITKHSGKASSVQLENLFLTKWLLKAKQQKRFSKDISSELDWLIDESRCYGVNISSRHIIEYIWASYSGKLSRGSASDRLEYVLSLIERNLWTIKMVSGEFFSQSDVISLRTNSIIFCEHEKEDCFDLSGKALKPVRLKVNGTEQSVYGFYSLLSEAGWALFKENDGFILVDTGFT